jgi:hypothetical protein
MWRESDCECAPQAERGTSSCLRGRGAAEHPGSRPLNVSRCPTRNVCCSQETFSTYSRRGSTMSRLWTEAYLLAFGGRSDPGVHPEHRGAAGVVCEAGHAAEHVQGEGHPVSRDALLGMWAATRGRSPHLQEVVLPHGFIGKPVCELLVDIDRLLVDIDMCLSGISCCLGVICTPISVTCWAPM